MSNYATKRYVFSNGYAYLKDVDGNAFQVGVLKDVSLDFDQKVEFLYGNMVDPVAAGNGERKISGKIKYAEFDGFLMSKILVGSTLTATTSSVSVNNEVHAVDSGSVTVTASHTTGFVDLGVLDSNGQALEVTASSPGTGSYTVNANTGAYLVNVAASGNVFLSYNYTTASYNQIAVANALMALSPTFSLHLNGLGKDAGGVVKPHYIKVHAVVIPKFSMAFKPGAFAEDDIDFQALATAAGTLTWNG